MKRARASRQSLAMWVLCVALALGVASHNGGSLLLAGGPLFNGGPTLGTDGQALLWDAATPIAYRVDGGGLGNMTNAAAIARVQAMFNAWQNVATASISYTNAGPIQSVASFSDGDVSTASEFSDVAVDCDAGNQTPIIFDADGNLFGQLGLPAGVIGFASACDSITGNHLRSGLAALNGRWINGSQSDDELTSAEFDQAFTHEFGHLSGLHHSQINVEVLNGSPNACSADNLAGQPLMFPFLFCQARTPANPILAPDDIAWISELYPETGTGAGQTPYLSAYGFIEGTIFFSDGVTHAQGVNVIARSVDNPTTTTQNESRRVAFSAVSGYRFTGSPGQNVTTNNPGSSFGSRNPMLIGTYRIPVTPGTYTVEAESIHAAFAAGSSVGPLQFPIPSPGPKEFWNSGESATDNTATSTTITIVAGQTMSGVDIILNGTPPRFDAFESAQLRPSSAPATFAVDTLAVALPVPSRAIRSEVADLPVHPRLAVLRRISLWEARAA